MIKKNLLWIIGGLLAGVVLAFIIFAPKPAGATAVQKQYVCHVEKPDEGGVNQQTLYLPLPGYLAHLLQHDADYAGECKEIEVTPTPKVTPSIDPCDGECEPSCKKDCEVEVTPTETPRVTPEPTAPPAPHGDGKSDGRSDGNRSSDFEFKLPPCEPGVCIDK